MMNRTRVTWIAGVGVAFVAGLLLRGWWGGDPAGHTHATGPTREAGVSAAFFTCSMHPQIRLPDPDAKCPICGMDLIPVVADSDDAGADIAELKMSPRALKLAEVETAAVERRFVTTEVRMVGKIEVDETRLASITAWVPGRLDRLYVNYTGVPVAQGDHLVDLYSPNLLAAQEELLQAITTAEDLSDSSSDYLRERATSSVQASKEKLRLWGLSEDQIAAIQQRGTGSDHITINSPISGIVMEKQAVEGMYVETGTRIYSIADLSRVWVKLDAYESDLPWLHYGQVVEFRTEAYPGEVFTGQIAFIDPILNASTRTVKIRVNLPNAEAKLKPEMFVRATVKAQVARGGRVMNPALSGKWISPMHPEIIKDAPGSCDVCGMDLVSAESLGYVSAAADVGQAPMVIPASAALITGKRAVVYVELEPGRYQGREIVLGPRAGDFYLVEAGLNVGEPVVVRGAFKIDSAIQILAKPSMMNPRSGDSGHRHSHGDGHGHGSDFASDSESITEREAAVAHEVPDSFREQLSGLTKVYLDAQQALSRDRWEPAETFGSNWGEAFSQVDVSVLEGAAQEDGEAILNRLHEVGKRLAEQTGIDRAREVFEDLSMALIAAHRQFGGSDELPVSVYHCPMAFSGRGADWIQSVEGTENPYYGSRMFRCGSVKETLVGQ